MTRLNVNNARCAALFASGLRQSDPPTADELTSWISAAVRRFGVAGCVSRMAQEFGDHPEAAACRMRWIRQLVATIGCGQLVANRGGPELGHDRDRRRMAPCSS